MKKTRFVLGMLGILAIALVFGMTLVSCGGDDDPDPDPLEGTWVSENIKLVAANGSIKEYQFHDFPKMPEFIRATYTYSGNTASGTITEVNLGEGWTAYANLTDEWKSKFPAGMTLTIVNNSFTVTSLDDDEQTFVRAPNFDGTWTHTTTGGTPVTITNVISGSDVTIKMGEANFQKGKFMFSSKMFYMNVTHDWEDGQWKAVGQDRADQVVTYEYTLPASNKFTLSDGLIDEEEPSTEPDGKGDKVPLFEGDWTRQ